MLDFYLETSSNIFTRQNILISPTLTETFDETLDSANVVLKATADDTLIKPDTRCYFKFNGTIVSNLVVASDTVEVVSHNPIKYQHTLQLVQNTRFLQKHLVRNSVFSQPNDIRRGYNKYLVGGTEAQTPENPMTLLQYNEKICPVNETTYIKVKLQFLDFYTTSSATRVNVTNFTSFKFRRGETYYPITSSTSIIFNFLITYTDNTTYSFTKSYMGNDNIITGDYDLLVPITPTKEVKSIKLHGIFALSGTTLGDGTFILNRDVVGNELDTHNTTLLAYYSFSTYYWTMYDVIDTLRKQYNLETTTYPNTNYLFNMPNSNTDLYKILKNTIAPAFTFTGATMYECLAEIFKYYDAIFTLDNDNRLGIEYLSDYSKNQVTKNFINRTQSFKEDGFTTGYVSYFENAIVEEEIYCLARNTQLGVNQASGDYYFILPHNIQSIIEADLIMEEGHAILEGGIDAYFKKGLAFDVTDWIFDTTTYSLLPASSSYTEYKSLINCLYYTDNLIHLGASTSFQSFSTGTVWQHFLVNVVETFTNKLNPFHVVGGTLVTNSTQYRYAKMKIRYRASVDGRVRVENETNKYKGEMIVNQSSGAVDTNKMGLNMLGLSYKLGEPTLSMTQEITTWADRIKKGDIVIYNDSRYLANIVKYSLYNDKIVATIEFIKNFNALSQRIQVDRQKRLSTISNELAVKSEDNYCEYLYFSTKLGNYDNLKQPIVFSDSLIFNALKMTFGGTYTTGDYPQVKMAVSQTYKLDGTLLTDRIYLPMAKYPAGNTLCFEVAYDSPISAGYHTNYAYEGSNAAFTIPLKYGDINGWADKINVIFADFNEDNTFENGTTRNTGFPYITANQMISKGSISGLKYYKKPNEIFALNYELIHLVMNDRRNIDFIGNQLITNSFLLKGVKKPTNFKFYYSTTEKYSPFDFKGLGSSVSCELSGSYLGLSVMSFTFTPSTIPSSYVSWAICDENGNIYFASNETRPNNQFIIYAITRHNRLE